MEDIKKAVNAKDSLGMKTREITYSKQKEKSKKRDKQEKDERGEKDKQIEELARKNVQYRRASKAYERISNALFASFDWLDKSRKHRREEWPAQMHYLRTKVKTGRIQHEWVKEEIETLISLLKRSKKPKTPEEIVKIQKKLQKIRKVLKANMEVIEKLQRKSRISEAVEKITQLGPQQKTLWTLANPEKLAATGQKKSITKAVEKDKEGKVINEWTVGKDVKEKVANHAKSVFTSNKQAETNVRATNDTKDIPWLCNEEVEKKRDALRKEENVKELERYFTETEIQNVLDEISKNKAAGPDGIPGELHRIWKEAKLTSLLLYIMNRIWKEEKMPSNWRKANTTLRCESVRDSKQEFLRIVSPLEI
jgi:hypothetical protein